VLLVGGKFDVKAVLGLEFVVFSCAVRLYADHHRTGRFEIGLQPREIDGLCGAAGGVVARVEIKDDGLSLKVGQAYRATAAARKVERGREVSEGKFSHIDALV